MALYNSYTENNNAIIERVSKEIQNESKRMMDYKYTEMI